MKKLLLCLLLVATLRATDAKELEQGSMGVSWTVPRYGWGGLFAGGGAIGAVMAHKKMKHHAQKLAEVREQLASDPKNEQLKALEKLHKNQKTLYKVLFWLATAGSAGGGLVLGDTFRQATLMPWLERKPNDYYSLERKVEDIGGKHLDDGTVREFIDNKDSYSHSQDSSGWFDKHKEWTQRIWRYDAERGKHYTGALKPEERLEVKQTVDQNERPYTYKNYVRQGIQAKRSSWQQWLNPWINWDAKDDSLNQQYVDPHLRRLYGIASKEMPAVEDVPAAAASEPASGAWAGGSPFKKK